MRILQEAADSDYEPNRYHDCLVDLPFRTYLTTNWDVLLEKRLAGAYGAGGCNVIASDSDLTTWNEALAIQVVKLHGTIDRPTELVVSEADYQRRYGQPSLLIDLVKVLFATRSILMLGFSLRDQYVRLLMAQVAAALETPQGPPHFMVVPVEEAKSTHAEYVRSLGIHIITAGEHPDESYPIEPVLRDLGREVATVARSRRERTRLLVRETRRATDYLGPDRTIRIRAVIGPLGNPDPGPNVIFGDRTQDELEAQLRSLCEQLVQQGFELKLIGHPTDLAFVKAKGYSDADLHRRLSTFVATARRLGPRFQFAPAARAADRNLWIVSRLAVIDSWKGSGTEGRLFSDAVVNTERAAVARAVHWFDDDFAELSAAAGGIEQARERVLGELEDLIVALSDAPRDAGAE